jgi:hypothetical protein
MWGLVQVIDGFAYDAKEGVLNAKDGAPVLTLAYCDWLSEKQPELADFAGTKQLHVDAYGWDQEQQIINVSAQVPADFVRLGVADLVTQLDERCRSWGSWTSTLPRLVQHYRWSALPQEMRASLKAARKSDERLTLPGSMEVNGEPREYRLRDYHFDDGFRGVLSADFQLMSLQALPGIYELSLHRWYADLMSYLACRPIVTGLKLEGHGQSQLDFGNSRLTELTIDASGLELLHIPASLGVLTLIGEPGQSLQIVSGDQGAWLTLRCSGGFERISGLERLKQLQVTNTDRCDVAKIAQAFPVLGVFKLWGKPSFLDNAESLAKLKRLDGLWLFETFGFEQIPGPEVLPLLDGIWVSSIPADAAATIKKQYKSVPGIDLTVERPRKDEWLAENLDNPLRAWDGRGGISAAQAKKAFAAYKSALSAMRKAVAAGDDLQAQAERITQDYIGVFNLMDAKRNFIDTMAREEIVDALHKVWALLPPSIDLLELERVEESLRDF